MVTARHRVSAHEWKVSCYCTADGPPGYGHSRRRAGRASTVMRARVLADAVLLHERDRRARAEFEMYALSDYARLNEERRGILEDARRTGHILG